MPTTFLDLPRELRDEIYSYLLVSPSGVISLHWIPPSLKPSRSTSPKPTPPTAISSSSQPIARFRLCTNPPKPRHALSLKTMRYREERQYISLSLPRTCRQIYEETQALFWEQNTFYFSDRNAGVIKTMKMMGQTPSRLITSVVIQMNCASEFIRLVSKTLNVLASRARFGHFRSLELIWDNNEFGYLQELSGQIPMGKARLYDELLEGLRTGESGGRFGRVIRLLAAPRQVGQRSREANSCARDLHFAFGGSLFWGDELGWENWTQVIPVENYGNERIL